MGRRNRPQMGQPMNLSIIRDMAAHFGLSDHDLAAIFTAGDIEE